jgi:hypothetical protein
MSFKPINSVSSRYSQCVVATSSYAEVKIRKTDSVMSQGVVWAPYIMSCSSTVIVDGPLSNRIRKLNKIIDAIDG